MEKDTSSQEKTSEGSPKYDEEDLLYAHKPESRGSTMQWNLLFVEDQAVRI